LLGQFVFVIRFDVAGRFLPFVRPRFLLLIAIVMLEYMLNRDGAELVIIKSQYAQLSCRVVPRDHRGLRAPDADEKTPFKTDPQGAHAGDRHCRERLCFGSPTAPGSASRTALRYDAAPKRTSGASRSYLRCAGRRLDGGATELSSRKYGLAP